MKTFISIVCSLALLGAICYAADKPAEKPADKKPCCEATVEAGLKCTNQCCIKAAKDGKVCEKCHPKKDEGKKAEKKDEKKS
jgi:hypothetical protein